MVNDVLNERFCEPLGPGGPFARKLDSFVVREGQLRLAEGIGQALVDGTDLVAEAGTGIGKTFAYLVPLLCLQRRAVISTATKALQDQLFRRDLPQAAKVLEKSVRVACLKGRMNYLCLRQLEAVKARSDWLGDARIETLMAWERSTRYGDLAELPLKDAETTWVARLAVDSEHCIGSACQFFSKCYVYLARRKALSADVVIVNHHLLVADLVKQRDSISTLLKAMDVVVVDEAHTLPAIARLNLGDQLALGEISELIEEFRNLGLAAASDEGLAVERVQEGLATSFRLLTSEQSRAQLQEQYVHFAGALYAAFEALIVALQSMDAAAEPLERCERILARLQPFTGSATSQEATGQCIWMEQGSGKSPVLCRAELETGARFRELRQGSDTTWVFTSATLGPDPQFKTLNRELGLDVPRMLRIESPFNHRHQGLLYLPDNLPAITSSDYHQRVLEAALPLIRVAPGGCFVLCTSWQACTKTAELLRGEELNRRLLVQGQAPRRQLLDEFREDGRGLLIGTASFWEGVDVKGDALVLVVIDRLPFEMPDDPVLAARIANCRALGGRPFVDIQLQEAVISLQQGAGRLIRSECDWGVLMIGDPRLRTKPYGKVFLKSLPDFPRTSNVQEAVDFLNRPKHEGRPCA